MRGVVEGGVLRDSAAGAGEGHETRAPVDVTIARSAPEVAVVARLAHLQDAAGNASVVRLLDTGAPAGAGDDASGAADPAP
ncbi:hypothetical protein J8M51_41970 [Streptomyces scabiei]|nr:hypothetical protein [Streptomyces griseiscabiei]